MPAFDGFRGGEVRARRHRQKCWSAKWARNPISPPRSSRSRRRRAWWEEKPATRRS